MRVPVIVPVLVLIGAACGGSDGSASTTSTLPPAPTTTVPPDDAAAGPVVTTTPAAPSTTEPGTAPVVDAAAEWPLSIEDALLPDDAFPAPWEPQRRVTDQISYGSGPNQTDCVPYWAFEELRGAGGGHAMWWVDGGNANHYVTRIDADNVGYMFAIASIADECPTVHWNEGGSFTTEAIELTAAPEAVGLKLTDASSGETTWLAVTRLHDLVSILDVPLWTNVDGEFVDFDADDLNRLAGQMDNSLRGALLASTKQPGTAPTTLAPPILVPATTGPPAAPSTTPTTTPSTTPTTTTALRPTTTLPRAVSGVGKLLLGRADLPAGFEEPLVRPHQRDEPDTELVAICPPAVSVDQIDAMLEWSAESTGEGVEIDQIIGRGDSAGAVSEVVQRFAEMASCDLSMALGEEAETSGGEISIAGADAAATLVIRATDGSFNGEVTALAVGDIVLIISVATTYESEWIGERLLDPDLTESIAELAVAKVRAAGA